MRARTTRSSARKTVVAIGPLLAVASMWLGGGCGSENSLVGGACAPGYEECDGRCVPVGTCTGADGSADVAAADASIDGSLDGALDGSLDGALDDGSLDGDLDGQADGSATDGSTDGGASDGGGDAGDACPPPPYTTAAHCGACNVQCTAPDDTCRLDGNDVWTCQPACTPPEMLCEGRCIDVSSDPFNCGTCGKVCPSNLCTAGVCQGATPGDIVVIGSDYRQALAASSQAKVLTNAVFIPTANPLRILSYERHAEPQAVANIKSIIKSAAGTRVLAYTVSNAAADLASPTLSQSYDVVLIYDQRTGNAATLQAEGTSWQPHLATFTKAGGIVVALDGNAGQGNMPVLITSAGLIDLAGHTTIPGGTRVSIVAPADRIATLVPTPYGAFDRSVTFQSNEPNGGNVTWVAQHDLNPGLGDPVVIHKVVP